MITVGKRVGLTTLATLLLVGATTPAGPTGAPPGLWEVSRSAAGDHAVRACLSTAMLLAQWEHRGAACTRSVIASRGDKATVQYSCERAGFGRSEMTLVTPRTLRVETQGISAGLPFDYVIHARRVADCRHR